MLFPLKQTDPLIGWISHGLQMCAKHLPSCCCSGFSEQLSPLSNLDTRMATRYQDKLRQELNNGGGGGGGISWRFSDYKTVLPMQRVWVQPLVRELRSNMRWWFSHYAVSDSCDPMHCWSPGSSVHGISQASILEWVAISFSRGSSWPRVWASVSCTASGLFYCR